jgi:hypothetical protein
VALAHDQTIAVSPFYQGAKIQRDPQLGRGHRFAPGAGAFTAQDIQHLSSASM